LQLNDVVLAYGRSIKHKSKWRSSVCLATYCKITNALVLQYTDAFESAFLQGCTEKVMIDSLLGPGCSGWRNPSRPLLRLQAVVCRGCNGEGAHALFCIHCKFRGQSHEIYYDFFRHQALTVKMQKAKPNVIPMKRQRELSPARAHAC
jgi:hypothetical protein